MKYFSLIITVIFFYSCKKEEILVDTVNLSNQNFDSGLRIEGHQFDSLVIDNCTFTGKPLNIGSVDNVIVKNCTFTDINGNGIMIGFIGRSSSIIIENCTFKNIGFNGIDCVEDTPNCIIKGCYFESTALSNIGGAMGQLHHAIYWKGENVQILNNHFVAGKQEQSDAISLRSSGLISGNIIDGFRANGITYYSDHPGGDTLIIENNFLLNNGFSITINSNENLDYHTENIIIRFNSMVQDANYSVYLASQFETTTNMEVYGNIMVNPSEEYFRKFNEAAILFSNLESKVDIGFVDMNNGDLHITNTSIANGYCSGLVVYPNQDIDGDLRSEINLDAGADENN